MQRFLGKRFLKQHLYGLGTRVWQREVLMVCVCWWWCHCSRELRHLRLFSEVAKALQKYLRLPCIEAGGWGSFFFFHQSVDAGCSWGGEKSCTRQLSSNFAVVGERKFWVAYTQALTTIPCLCCSDPVGLYKVNKSRNNPSRILVGGKLKRKKKWVHNSWAGLGATGIFISPTIPWCPWLATLVI